MEDYNDDKIGSNPKKKAKIVKKSCKVNVGKVYDLIEGKPLPDGIDKRFHDSFKLEGII